MLNDFTKISGLRINDKKTETLLISASIVLEIYIYKKSYHLERNYNGQNKLKGKNSRATDIINSRTCRIFSYSKKLEKVKEILKCLKYRRLTLLDKIAVITGLTTDLFALCSLFKQLYLK